MEFNFNFPVILFDGVCNLCNASVQWILKRDKAARFRFASLQSDTGRQLLAHFGLAGPAPDTVVVVWEGRLYTRSDAALEIARLLGSPWSWFSVFRIVPRRMRNALYNWVARHRYRWFGRRAECWLPRPEWKDRFI